jgi:hypothetical protein
MFETLGGGGYAVLERMEGEVPGYLSYSTEEGEVVCVFESIGEAEDFYERWRDQIPDVGWRAVRLENEDLRDVLKNFDLVVVNPNPMPGSQEYMYRRDDFLASLGGAG